MLQVAVGDVAAFEILDEREQSGGRRQERPRPIQIVADEPVEPLPVGPSHLHDRIARAVDQHLAVQKIEVDEIRQARSGNRRGDLRVARPDIGRRAGEALDGPVAGRALQLVDLREVAGPDLRHAGRPRSARPWRPSDRDRGSRPAGSVPQSCTRWTRASRSFVGHDHDRHQRHVVVLERARFTRGRHEGVEVVGGADAVRARSTASRHDRGRRGTSGPGVSVTR